MRPVSFSRQAEKDLEEIGDFIAKDSPRRAVSFIQGLRDHCQKISQFPDAYPRFPELGPEVRFLTHGKYIVLYRAFDEDISIERVLHGARDILALIKK